ncbi:EamA family transporter [Acetobacterium wieringae]|jgi:drug/metabolite transporter (DMT)-like permease|uniref:EamA family transporter n=2 Tax=Acetobacterium wieringae TaxID=52694 RepID=A0A1F2PGD5_9FIRM|nr:MULTISPECIES: EamA family transporter [Acetobacterium]HAZ06573.1 transporter [Acetobacterium sp.]OFV70115.1 EamA-like transporter family protein [Acetobacterium wieringae]TYC87347.1 EamA family transporter [Acetobacterium wieringae]URN84652.1 EamA family transporter [Acetobacterium wieringae]UYO63111.1 EamA family transporter [Acetobacterium wieringae]
MSKSDENRGTLRLKNYLFLHASLLLYSIGSVFSKMASKEVFLSWAFILYYGLFLLILFVYAILWQQILKRFPLTVAFANKAITILWGIVWGYLFFGEALRWGMLLGSVIIVSGIYLVVSDDK